MSLDIVLFLLPLSILMASLFAWLFLRAVRQGQFHDLDDAAVRALEDEGPSGH